MEDRTPDLDPPDGLEWIWEWFWELSATRRQGPNGPDAVTYADIDVWVRLTGTQVLREEITVLRRMDDAFLAALNEEYRDQRERESPD